MGEKVQRRLAAVVAADIVGYSRLMAEDEEGTLARVQSLRDEVTEPTIVEHGGRIVKRTGDGALVEFSSVVDAVRAALDVQRQLHDGQDGFPDNQRIVLRIGINLGDVLIENEDIFGDGVNIAARLEQLCVPGEVMISGSAFDQLEGRSEFSCAYLGEQQLKNITRPVRAYRLSAFKELNPAGHPVEPQQDAPMAQPLPDKPSIVVLPFAAMSADPEQGFFCDGMSEDITTALSRFSNLFVIARNTAFTFKGANVNVRDISRELGVQYILEGSSRNSGNRIRVNAQLIDAVNDRHVWAEKYDRHIEDLFAVQDEITEAIAMAIAPEIEAAEIERNRARPISELGQWQKVARASSMAYQFRPELNSEATEILKEAHKADPSSIAAPSLLGMVYIFDTLFNWNRPQAESLKLAATAAATAVAIDHRDAQALTVLGGVMATQKRHLEAVAHYERAIEANPNYSLAVGTMGMVLTYLHEYDRATGLLERAIRLSPRDPWMPYYVAHYGMRDLFQHKYESALAYGLEASRINPKNPSILRLIGAAQGMLGRTSETKATVAKLLEMAPEMTLTNTRAAVQFAFDEDAEIFCEGLRRGGMPE